VIPGSGAHVAVGSAEHRVLDAALDAVIQTYGSGDWTAEVVGARDEYSERTGRVFEEDELYEARTAAFLEWYACDRPSAREGQPPVVLALAGAGDDTRDALEAWASSHRSLFVVQGMAGPSVRLLDLLGGAEVEVEEARRLHGVARGDILEARVVGFRERVRFGRTFLYHPAAAREAIVRQGLACMAGGGSRADAVDLVARLRVRALRYKHVAPEKVYEMGLPGSPATGEHRR
jgi:hypothetical protein